MICIFIKYFLKTHKEKNYKEIMKKNYSISL